MVATFSKPEAKADGNSAKQTKAEQGRTPSVMVGDSSPLPDLGHAPDVQSSAVQQRKACDDGERPSSGKSE